MEMLKLIVVCCLVVGLSSIVQADKTSDFDSRHGFYKVNKYLVAKLADSNDTEANLEALRELIAAESGKSKWNTFFTKEGYTLKAAKGVVHLMEVAKDENKKCNRETIDNLIGLLKAHFWQDFFSLLDDHQRLLNETALLRIDDLIEPKLPILVSKCEQYKDVAYKQKWSTLNQKAKETIELAMSESILNETRGMNYDSRIIATKFAKKVDRENYKRTLELQNMDAFVKYYKDFYQNKLLKPCKVYKQHMDDLMEPVNQLDSRFIELKIPVYDRTADFLLGQIRWKICWQMQPKKYDKYILDEQARAIYASYIEDANNKYKPVNWDSLKEGRMVFRPRLY